MLENKTHSSPLCQLSCWQQQVTLTLPLKTEIYQKAFWAGDLSKRCFCFYACRRKTEVKVASTARSSSDFILGELLATVDALKVVLLLNLLTQLWTLLHINACI